MSEIRLERTEGGFKFGAAEVSAMCVDEKEGWSVISINTPKRSLQVHVTRTGQVRIFNQAKGELSEQGNR